MIEFAEGIEPVPVPLLFASVDNCVADLIDVNGNVLRDSVEVTRPPDPVNAADLDLIEPVNRGAGDALRKGSATKFVDTGEPMIEPEHGERPERFTEAYVKALMKQPRDGNAPSGGGSSGRKRTKPAKITIAEPPARGTGGNVPCLRVTCLEPAVAEYYARRPGEAATALRGLLSRIINEDDFSEAPRPLGKQPAGSLDVLEHDGGGLTNPERRVLAHFPNAARAALIAHALASMPPPQKWPRRAL